MTLLNKIILLEVLNLILELTHILLKDSNLY